MVSGLSENTSGYEFIFFTTNRFVANIKELYILAGKETFANKPEFLKVDARAALLKKSTGFCRMSVTTSLLRMGALLRDNCKWVVFPSIDVGFYWLA